ncbi:MAG: fumarylacetoacetate hydrolase family protein [Gammaproteobacteria bacterium]|nr:2-hydroxyhepta-2,4-diene-1,7-dioate isomerase [Gammaproteobacteria bacterium]
MRFASFHIGERASFGLVVGNGIVDVGARLTDAPTLRALLERGELEKAAALADRGADHALDDVRFLPTIPDPGKIICIGINYGRRDEEYAKAEVGEGQAKYPSVFFRTPESLVGHHEPILRPLESEQLDYEGEIVLVIGRGGRRIPEERAWQHVAGLTLMNEGSVRDWLRHAKFNVTPGKNFEKSGSLGPWMVTVDEIPDPARLHLTTRVNGELRQDDTTANLLFSFAKLIAYTSTFMPLEPGDVIATGTPTGAGARFDPPRYLKPGDVVEVSVPEIGTLRNPVVDEADSLR